MKTDPLLSQVRHCLMSPCSVALLVALAWNNPAFGGEIHDAAKTGDLAKVMALLAEDPASVSSQDTNGCTPLHLAAGWGHKDVAALLLGHHADVNAREATDGWTPLHAAAANGQKDVVKLLLANKAELNAKAGGGYTSLHWAALKGQEDVVKLLLANHAEVSVFTAAAVGDLKKLKALLKTNPGLVSSKDEYRRTPLHWATTLGYNATVAWLLAEGANVNAMDNGGETPLHYAAGKNHKGVVKLLLANKADVNARSTSGATPLHAAALGNYRDVVELLRQHGGVESKAPPDVARLKQALLGNWAIDQEATVDSMARGKFGPQRTVSVSRSVDSLVTIRTNFTHKPFNQQEYEQAKRILLESFRANDRHTWMTFAPDGTGTESELSDSGTRSNNVQFRWTLQDTTLKVEFPNKAAGADFQTEFSDTNRLCRPMPFLRACMFFKRDPGGAEH